MELKKIKYEDVPNRALIVYFLECIKDYFYPNYFSKVDDVNGVLNRAKDLFRTYISSSREDEQYFFSHLYEVKDILSKDIEMFYESDPACESYEEVILTYPGFYAIYVHRVAHILYELKIPLIPRMMSEYAHSKTGIDIHPGANIGNYFFIDHGTGIVIGETTLIGERVKIYQGVTLGALSLKDGQRLKGSKRHPTIGNNVTIYSGASILGGDTVIGDNVTIGSSVFLTYSVPSSMKVINKAPELILKEKKED